MEPPFDDLLSDDILCVEWYETNDDVMTPRLNEIMSSYDDPVYEELGAMVDTMLNDSQLITQITTSRRRKLERETLEKNGWVRYPDLKSKGKQPRFKYVNRHTHEEVTSLQKALSKCPKSRKRRLATDSSVV